MRKCPECLEERKHDGTLDQYHLCDGCMEKILAKYSGQCTKAAVVEISEIYARVGLPHAGPMPLSLKKSKKLLAFAA